MVFQEEAFAPAAPWADQRASSLGAHFLFSPSGGGYKECLSAVLSWLTAHHGHNVTLGEGCLTLSLCPFFQTQPSPTY